MSKTFVIAECATTWYIGKSAKNHLAKAIKCIRMAKDCGADAVKFQWTSAPAMMAQRRHVTNLCAYYRLAWPKEWLPILAAECEDVGIEFMCTVYLPQDVATIAPYVRRFKIASLEAHDGKFCQSCIDTGKSVIISLGASEYAETQKFFPRSGFSWTTVRLLQCTAGYPTPLDQLQLLLCKGIYDGLSDHSGDLLAGAFAVAAGAEIVEVHFRLDETRKDNPDFAHSHAPASLRRYIANIRKAEIMLGDGIKKIEECERPLIKHRVLA